MHVVEVSEDERREGGTSVSGADTPKPEKCLNAEPASVAPDPDPAPGFTVRSGIAFDLDATGPLPDVREDAETLEAARRLREGRLVSVNAFLANSTNEPAPIAPSKRRRFRQRKPAASG